MRTSAATGALLFIAAGLAGGSAVAATSLWWDASYAFRINVDVATGANLPDKGYSGYTARIPSLDTEALIAAGDMRADCADLRVLYFDGLAWTELPRHVLGCNTATTDLRFMLAANIAANAGDDNYYIYHGNASPAALPAMTETNVYLWFDDAAVNRAASYVRGRVDNWHGDGWDNSLAWNAAGYYSYSTGDNNTSGYRRAIDERDVYIEAEFMHTGCFQFNITTGLLLRGIIQNGTLGSESSDHYYASNRGQYPGCDGSGYDHDGDIVENQRPNVAVNGPNPPSVLSNTWRRQGLAAWLTSPTNLAFWDEDVAANWAALGYPSGANLQLAGTDNDDQPGRGFAALMTAQDIGRFRNVLMRRYVSPEPVLVLTPETQPPVLLLQKSVDAVYDPVNDTANPKAIPGSWVEYTINATNSGAGDVDADTLAVTDPLPANVALFVGDLAGPGSGPVEFIDGSGSAASGLSYSFGSLSDASDDVEFSQDGSDWSYVPVPDAAGFDPAVRHIRVSPGGSFAGTDSATPTRFDLRFRVRVD